MTEAVRGQPATGTGDRPGLDRLRDKARARELDRVLITAPDRLARNYVHQMVLLEELEATGCAVEFLDRPMSQDPHDQLLLQIRGAVAECGQRSARNMGFSRRHTCRALEQTHFNEHYAIHASLQEKLLGVQR